MSISHPLLRRAAGWLLAQDCYVCASPAGDDLLCGACAAELPRLAGPRCPVCALPTPDGETCGRCLRSAPHYDATYAVFAYAFPVEELVQALKYRRELAVAPFLASRLTAALAGVTADIVLPMPLHPRRLAERGFNQAAELARVLAKALALPLLLEGLQRRADTTPQAALPWDERRRNVRGAFETARRWDGKTVLVVDDVMTTGATLDEAARTLKRQGAARVINAVVARTLPP